MLTKLQELHKQGYQLAIFSNQKGISSERDKNKGKRGGPKETSILGRFDQFLEQVGDRASACVVSRAAAKRVEPYYR